MPQSTGATRIWVGVDGSPASDAAVRWVAREHVICGSPITVAHVITPASASVGDHRVQLRVDRWQEFQASKILDAARAILAAHANGPVALDVETKLYTHGIVPALVDATKDAAMVVVGRRGMGMFGRHLLGSVSAGLVHHAHCPVAVIHEDGAAQSAGDRGAPVLLGVDGSSASELATSVAFEMAARRGVGLVALHAWSDVGVFPILGMDWKANRDEGGDVLARSVSGWQEKYPDVKVERHLHCDQPARWLVEESQRAQLVVVGSRGRGGFSGMLLGSVSSAVAQSARVPVIVARRS